VATFRADGNLSIQFRFSGIGSMFKFDVCTCISIFNVKGFKRITLHSNFHFVLFCSTSQKKLDIGRFVLDMKII